jgi:hypothetical protein
VARDGGLLSYGPEVLDVYRHAATYVDRILRGANPADLPVQFPEKFVMALNLRAAAALGLTIPPNLLAIATRSSNETAGFHCGARERGGVAAGGGGAAANNAGDWCSPARLAWDDSQLYGGVVGGPE